MAPGTKAKKAKTVSKRMPPKGMLTDRIIKWRKAKGYSQKDVADILGYDRSTISKLEHGQEPPDKFWNHWRLRFKGSNPRVDFFTQNGKPA